MRDQNINSVCPDDLDDVKGDDDVVDDDNELVGAGVASNTDDNAPSTRQVNRSTDPPFTYNKGPPMIVARPSVHDIIKNQLSALNKMAHPD